MAPVYVTILLGLILNALADAPCLSAAYSHVCRQQTGCKLKFLILFILFALSNLRYLLIIIAKLRYE